MTMRQLHYTSCQDGLEGIEGFQVSAATPGVPKTMVDLAVRTSAYEAGPAFIRHLADDDLSMFPMAFGYATEGRGGALFQSRYVGRDFTGRLGNYFAHAVLVDDVDHEFADTLPIDLWQSPGWRVAQEPGVTQLPELDRMPPGPANGSATIRQFMAGHGRSIGLMRLISAVQSLLTGPRERLVVVVADDQDAARWLAALTRSLPRHLSLRISFVTYTSRPDEQEVLVSCVTPDIRISAYGGFTVLDLTNLAPGDDSTVTSYARVLTDAWQDGRAEEAVTMAETLRPELTAEELDLFATVAAMSMGYPVEPEMDERDLVSAIAFAEQRLPAGLSVHGWRAAADATVRSGLCEADRWEPVIRSALHDHKPVPAELVGAYYVAALTGHRLAWVPRIDTAQLADIAGRVVVPALTTAAPVFSIDRLADQHELMDAVALEMDRRLAGEGFVEVATTMTPEAADVLARCGRPYPRVRRLVEVVLARHGKLDRIGLLAGAAQQGNDWFEFGRVLWPDLPSAEDGIRAVEETPAHVLAATGLTERFVERILQDADDGPLSTHDVNLAVRLLDTPCVTDIPLGGQTALNAVRVGARLRNAVIKHVTPDQVSDALSLTGSVAPGIARHLLEGVLIFLFRVDEPTRHMEMLTVALRTDRRRFLTAYREAAHDRLAEMSPHRVALLTVAWAALDDEEARRQLLEEVLADGLSRRRRSDLDKIGDVLTRMPTRDALARAAGVRGGGWAKWWQDWRSRHERRGLLSRLLSRPPARKR